MPRPVLKRPTVNFYTAVYKLACEVPPGRVVTYGLVATWLGSPRAAREVGYALAANLHVTVPWQRVVNAQGAVSVGGALWRSARQRKLLEDEGSPLTPRALFLWTNSASDQLRNSFGAGFILGNGYTEACKMLIRDLTLPGALASRDRDLGRGKYSPQYL